MVELVVVVGLIVVMAAVGLPNLVGYLRQARVRGATNQVAGEIQTARTRAIKKNVNPGPTGGVVFSVLDQDSYRFTVLDDNRWRPSPPDHRPGLAPLRDLPQGVVFEPGVTNPTSAIVFDSMGRVCRPLATGETSPPCTTWTSITAAQLCADANADCYNRPTGNYIDEDATIPGNTTFRVRVREISTGLVRTVSINVGGKVQAQR